ncbi:unnamed protein product [Mortierella alpina]
MQELDPALFLFIPQDEYTPLHLDPALFESVGNGVTTETLAFAKQSSPPLSLSSSPAEPMPGLKSLATLCDAYGQVDAKEEDGVDQPRLGSKKGDTWELDWEKELDERISHIERPNIFDSFHDPYNNFPCGVKEHGDQPSSASEAAARENVVSTSARRDQRRPTTYTQWNSRSVFGSLSHPAGTSTLLTNASKDVKNTTEVEFELPALTKRPRDILDECVDRDRSASIGSGHQRSEPDRVCGQSNKEAKLAKSDKRPDSWRALGTPQQQDVSIAHSQEPTKSRHEHGKPRLTWETCSTSGPKEQSDKPFVSPYITEAGTLFFEAVYQRHTKDAFKFRPKGALVSKQKLVESVFLLLGGTSSSVFAYNASSMRFETGTGGIRIEGCSTASVHNLLQDLMIAGTHMKRLCHVADRCINHSEEMGLIRIAFGRSLSSYLTFLQVSIVALQETSQKRYMHILELHHTTHDMAVVLERLARLCQCHISQDASARFGFDLPAGPDLLTNIYEEVLKQPMTSDPLWVALLLSFLDQASKPYRDILSRWLGITPSTHIGHERSHLSRIANARRLSTEPNHFTESTTEPRRASGMGRGGSLFSIFDTHLQQSLQGLDPFGEFFVESTHGWSWDGAEPIILGDPLDYTAEFRMRESVKPAGFISERLAERVMEAGKELQILIEFEPRHPLIAHDRNSEWKSNGFKWLYAQSDIALNKQRCSDSSNEVLRALALRLQSMKWIEKRISQRLRRSILRQDGICQLNDSSGAMDLDTSQPSCGPVDGEAVLGLGLDPELQGFFLLSSTIGQTSTMSLACPDMMAFLLDPSTPSTSLTSSPQSTSPCAFPGSVLPAHDGSSSACLTPAKGTYHVRLDSMAPLTVLAEHSLCDSIRARTLLVNTCLMSLYFHDLNLLGHLKIMERFMLMKDGQFVMKLGEALFLDETGLLNRCTQAAYEAESATSDPKNERRSSMASSASGGSSASTWRNVQLKWPPRSGELEMTLRAVLLECFHSSVSKIDSVGSGKDSHDVSDVSEMDVEETVEHEATPRRAMKRDVDAQELEESLAFAVKEYDDQSKIGRDANALDALDFLYLDYKAPRPLRLLLFTPAVFEKYTRLFTFQLRLARVDAALKQVYRRLRTQDKGISRICGLVSFEPQQQKAYLLYDELQVMHAIRFEAQKILDGFRGYITDVAMGSTWHKFMDRLKALQVRLEDRILSSSNGGDTISDDGDDIEQDGQELENLADLHRYHDHVLNRMLLQSLLKPKQAPVLSIVHGILNCILKWSHIVNRLPEATSRLLQDPVRLLEQRVAKMQKLHTKFRTLCRMLIKVLTALIERGIDLDAPDEDGKCAQSTGRSSTETEFLQQLLLRLDMSRFHSP